MSEAATRIEQPPAQPMLRPAEIMRVARLGLIVSHLWIFLLPALPGGIDASWIFWTALAYVTVPLGLLIYGWNDYFDADVDRLSPRKNGGASNFFGPRLPPAKRGVLPLYIALFQVPFVLIWALAGRWDLVGWMALMALGNALYNGPGVRLSRVPFLAELVATGIYLLIGWLAVLTYAPQMAWWYWLFGGLTILNLQLMGAVVDADEDAAVGKKTFAVAFGRPVALAVIILALFVKAGLTFYFTGNLVATGLMLLGAALVGSRLSVAGVRPSAIAYNAFLFLDWIWLAVMFLS